MEPVFTSKKTECVACKSGDKTCIHYYFNKQNTKGDKTHIPHYFNKQCGPINCSTCEDVCKSCTGLSF